VHTKVDVRGKLATQAVERTRGLQRRDVRVEQTAIDLAAGFHVIRVEHVTITGMTRSAGGTLAEPGLGVRAKALLTRGILACGCRALLTWLEQKAPARLEHVNPTDTSRSGNACQLLAGESHKNQEDHRCAACGQHVVNAMSAALHIAERVATAGPAVATRADR
jgi:putative transposase